MCLSELNGYRICSCIIDLFILPIVCILGLILNCSCLLVFSRVRSHPLVPALIILSSCDLLQLLFSIFVLFIPALHDFTDSDRYGLLGQIAYLSTGFLSPLLLASNCASIWTITYISIQRHHAIISPLEHMKSPRRRFLPLFLISLSALIFNMCKWAEFHWKWLEVKRKGQTHWILAHDPSALFENSKYRTIVDHYLYPICVYLIPLILLCVLHFRILTALSTKRISYNHKARMVQEKRSVALLISIVILFFLCHTGGIVFRFVNRPDFPNIDLLVLMVDIVNLLFNVNSFANPMLYFFFTRQFSDLRDNFLQVHFPNVRVSGGATSPMGHSFENRSLRVTV
ncbi:unnamed protein product [Auanema sp. JU1783]|nr:unnamed protein product [Auanema sp. JU1783]